MATRKKSVNRKPAVKKTDRDSAPAPAKNTAAKTTASKIGRVAAACANLASLRESLAAEKGKVGAADRTKVIRALESLEAGYQELHKKE